MIMLSVFDFNKYSMVNDFTDGDACRYNRLQANIKYYLKENFKS